MTGFEWFGDLVPFVVRALSDLGHSTAVVWTNRDVLIRRRSDFLRGLERIPAVGASTIEPTPMITDGSALAK